MTEEQIQNADDLVDQTITIITEDPSDFPEIKDQVPNMGRGQAGSGIGSDKARIKPLRLVFPEWLERIQSSLKNFYAPKKIRKGMDYEEALKGVFRKAREKVSVKENALYVFIDTSGSMWGYTDKNGVKLIRLFASFFPVIAKQYLGEVWMSDYAEYNAPEPIKRIIPLKEFRSGDMDDIVIEGGGGTAFWGIWQYFDKKVREAQTRNKDAKVMLIFFSDMEADFSKYPELIEGKNVIFVSHRPPQKGDDINKYINGDNIKFIVASS